MKLRLPSLGSNLMKWAQDLLKVLSRHEFAESLCYRRLVFATSGTWTKRPNLGFIKVTVVGGGGGAGYATVNNNTVISGAGGGGWASEVISEARLDATETVTVGAGGTGGVAATATVPTSGGTSSFGAFMSATGGGVSESLSTSATVGYNGAGGVGSGGDVRGNGVCGGMGILSRFGGSGGASIMGGGPRGSYSALRHGANATTYGAGGSGGIRSSDVDANGGAGKSGVVIVEEFYNVIPY